MATNKPTPTAEDIAKRRIEPDDVPLMPGAEPEPVADAGQPAPSESAAVNSGYGVPGDAVRDTGAPILDRANRVLAGAHARVHPPISQGADAPPVDASRRPVTAAGAKFAKEVYAQDFLDAPEEPVMDMMTSNVVALQMVEPVDPGTFREFTAGERKVVGQRGVIVEGKLVQEDVIKNDGQLAYEAFMNEPVVIRIHATKDKNEPPVVFIGVNGDSRWLPRNKPIRVQRKFVERLAQAQEMAFTTTENKDPNVDNAMTVSRSIAASYEFSVLQDDTEAGRAIGRRWLARMIRSGS